MTSLDLGPRAVAITPREDYSLLVTFDNGETRIYDVRPLLTEGVFQRLNDVDFFMQAHAKYGTVVWDEELDIAPESLYADSVLT
ncbi:MAG: DUF2442 domain-containing protein [Clostridia bacterium]|nr:DUF2442 domain-containing protein [Clostridia bacterium]